MATDATPEDDPAGHEAHALTPLALEYLPTPQLVQAALPLAFLNVPTAHGEHAPPSGPVDPALQVQAARAELKLGELESPGHARQVDAAVAPAVAEYVPTPQLEQAALPPPSLYVPAPHGVHAPPFRPVYPALQVQAVSAELKLGELESPGHARQVIETVAPVEIEYVPAPHGVQVALPVKILYVPTPHGEHAPPFRPVYPALQVQAASAELKLGELESPGHARQVVTAVAPVEAEYVPAPHGVQVPLPVAILYVPTPHGEHVPPSGPVDPALQVQAARAELKLGELELPGHVWQVDAAVAPVEAEYVPAPHGVQVALPLAILYVPTPHGEHVPPSGPVDPALQVQAARAELKLGELELTGHVWQVDAAVAPVEAEYVPAPHGVQVALPLAILYVPTPHGKHVPPSGPVDPALQVQAARAELKTGELELPGHVWQVDAAVAPAVGEYVPTPQLEQAALPPPSLYVPVAHGAHTPPFRPVYPALQVHAVTAELVLRESAFTGHTTHVVAAVAAVDAE
jgi:hypothetical protein